jgi:hypothetical protein
MCGPRQHGIFGRDPAGAFAFQKRRHFLFDRRRTDHFGVAHFDQDRPFGVLDEISRDFDGTKLILASAVCTKQTRPCIHEISPEKLGHYSEQTIKAQ